MSGLLASAVTCLAELGIGQNPRADTDVARRWSLARKTREYIEAHFREPVELDDICLATGAGVRALQRAFRQCFDLTISEYLKTVRLDALDLSLRKGHPTESTVAEIGLRNGFTHLGRMSVLYRDRFGVTPRQRLRERLH